MSVLLKIVSCATILHSAAAFSVGVHSPSAAFSPRTSRMTMSLAQNDVEQNICRRDSLLKITAAISGATATVLGTAILPANADIITYKLQASASLRMVKRATRQLDDMGLLVAGKDYIGVHDAIRVPPFTEVRKNCSIVIAAAEDTAESGSLQQLYADFKKAIEDVNTKAEQGIRGKKDVEIQGSYDDAVKNLKSFIEVGERAITPVEAAL